MYPKKTPKQAQEDMQAKKIINQQQREQLKALVSQKLQTKYPTKDPETVKEKTDNFFKGQQALTSESLKELDNRIAQTRNNEERDDISVRSGVSKMSGATNFVTKQKTSDSGAKKGNTVIDLNLARKNENGKAYRNEEEEWADIYKYNQTVYKVEADLQKDRKRHEKSKFRSELDEQVAKKDQKRQSEFEEKGVDHQQVMLKIQKEEKKEKKIQELNRAKMTFEKEMRDKQTKEIKAQRRQELKDEKQLDGYIITRIREEMQEDDRIATKRRQEEMTGFRKILQENEVKRQKMLEQNEREKKEETRQIQEQCRLIEEKAKAREEEMRAKDEKIRKALEMAKELVGKPNDEREKRQEMKVQKWTSRKEQEEEEEDLRQKHLVWQKQLDNKVYREGQVQEKAVRKKEDKMEREEQAKIWKNSTEKYAEFEKEKADARKEQMKTYAVVLKEQMHQKFEERRITDRLFDLRTTQYETRRAQAN